MRNQILIWLIAFWADKTVIHEMFSRQRLNTTEDSALLFILFLSQHCSNAVECALTSMQIQLSRTKIPIK